MKKTFALAVAMVALMLTATFNTSCTKNNKDNTADSARIADSLKQVAAKQKAAEKPHATDPRTEEYLREDVDRWTHDGDKQRYFSKSLLNLIDSVEQMAYLLTPTGDGFLKVDPWLQTNDRDENGYDSLIEVKEFKDSIATIIVETHQYQNVTKKEVNMVLEPDNHWYIDDFKFEREKASLRNKCEEGAKSLDKKLIDKAGYEQNMTQETVTETVTEEVPVEEVQEE